MWGCVSAHCRTGESVLLWQDDKTLLMAQNWGVWGLSAWTRFYQFWLGNEFTPAGQIGPRPWLESQSANSIWQNVSLYLDWYSVKGVGIYFHKKRHSMAIHCNQQLNVQLSSGVHQLSSRCPPPSPLSSHQRPTLAFCPWRANGWKLLETLEHKLMPLAITLSLYSKCPVYIYI